MPHRLSVHFRLMGRSPLGRHPCPCVDFQTPWKIRSVPFRSVPDYYPSHKNPVRSGPVIACSDPFHKIQSGTGGGRAGSRRRAEVQAASPERSFRFFKTNKSCRSRRDMKIARVMGFWQANGVEIWPFPFRSVPIRSMNRSVVFRSVPA